MIEKHFTDDQHREGPDHPFSMDPDRWADMVQANHENWKRLWEVQIKWWLKMKKKPLSFNGDAVRAARDLKAG